MRVEEPFEARVGLCGVGKIVGGVQTFGRRRTLARLLLRTLRLRTLSPNTRRAMPKLFDIVPALAARRDCDGRALLVLVGRRTAPDRSEYAYTLSQKKLLDIIEEQDRFFERIRGKSRMSRSDALSLKSKIDALWAEYLAEFPDDVDALVLNGKFLRATGDDELSYKQFSHADALSPNLPVVKQQLANYEAEHGLANNAYDIPRGRCRSRPKIPSTDCNSRS